MRSAHQVASVYKMFVLLRLRARPCHGRRDVTDDDKDAALPTDVAGMAVSCDRHSEKCCLTNGGSLV